MDLDLGMEGTWGREIAPERINSMSEFAPSISITANQQDIPDVTVSISANRIILDGNVLVNGTALRSISGCMWDCSVGYWGSVPMALEDSVSFQVTFSNQHSSSFEVPIRGQLPDVIDPPSTLTSGDSLVVRFARFDSTHVVRLHHFYNGPSGSGGMSHTLTADELKSGVALIPASRFLATDFSPPNETTISVSLITTDESFLIVDGQPIQVRTTLSDDFELTFLTD